MISLVLCQEEKLVGWSPPLKPISSQCQVRDLWLRQPIWSSYDGHTNSIRSNCYELTHQFYPAAADQTDFLKCEAQCLASWCDAFPFAIAPVGELQQAILVLSQENIVKCRYEPDLCLTFQRISQITFIPLYHKAYNQLINQAKLW